MLVFDSLLKIKAGWHADSETLHLQCITMHNNTSYIYTCLALTYHVVQNYPKETFDLWKAEPHRQEGFLCIMQMLYLFPALQKKRCVWDSPFQS